MTKQKLVRLSVCERIKAYLSRQNREAAGITNRDKDKDIAPYLHDVLVWQEIGRIAENELKHAWDRAQAACAAPSDDMMRAKGSGEHTVASTTSYVAIAKVAEPGLRFDQETFVTVLCRKYRLRDTDVLALIERTKKESKAALSKRVLEA